MAKMMPGNANTRSVSRMIAPSTTPPRYPAMAPAMLPMIRASVTSRTASGMVTRAPWSTRENTSRPSPSVPNQWSPLGEVRRGKSWASGSWGAIHGANTITNSQNAAMTIPMSASGRRQAAPRRERGRRRPTVSAVSTGDAGRVSGAIC